VIRHFFRKRFGTEFGFFAAAIRFRAIARCRMAAAALRDGASPRSPPGHQSTIARIRSWATAHEIFR
jgi:hypothetical protein